MQALGELTAAVKGASAALIVTAANGMHALSIGDADAFSVPVRRQGRQIRLRRARRCWTATRW